MKEYSNTEELINACLALDVEFLSEVNKMTEEEKNKHIKIEKEMIEKHQMFYNSFERGYCIEKVGFVESEINR